MEAQYVALSHASVFLNAVTIYHTADLLGVQWMFQLVQMWLMNYPSSLHSSRKLYISEMILSMVVTK